MSEPKIEVDFAEIDHLLHDAEHAEAGYTFAMMVGHVFEAQTLRSKSDHLIAMANALDPKHTAPAWSEADV